MANDGAPSGHAGSRCGTTLTRVDLLTFLVAAMLFSASYCLGIWHNSRGAADGSRVLLLGPSAGVATSCAGEADDPLDFEAHHAAEGAGLSVSSSSATATATGATTRTRRALRGIDPDESTLRHRVAWAWIVRFGGGSLRSPDAGAVRV